MNLSNTGTAQGIAELAVFSGMGYRLVCMVPFLVVTILYILAYGKKIKADPTRSYIYGTKVDFGNFDPENVPTFEKRHIPVAFVVLICIAYMIYIAIFSSLSYASAIFIYMGLLSGITYRMSVDQMCKSFANGAKGMATTGVLIGFAYAISGILSAGNVMDTVVNALANALGYFPTILQVPVHHQAVCNLGSNRLRIIDDCNRNWLFIKMFWAFYQI